MSVLKRALLCALLAVFVVSLYSGIAFAVVSYHRDAAVVGKVISYDADDKAFIIYGRLSVKNKSAWKIIERQKFYKVMPKTQTVQRQLNNKIGKGVKAFGSFQAGYKSNEDYLFASKIYDYDPNAELKNNGTPAYGQNVGPFTWLGFGVATLPQKCYYYELSSVNTFVDKLAGLRTAILGYDIENISKYKIPPKNWEKSVTGINVKTYIPQLASASTPELKQAKQRVSAYWKQNYIAKWCVKKNNTALNQITSAVGGSTFFKGLKGGGNNLIESVPAMRPQINKYMSGGSGGSNEIESGPAVFLGTITVNKDGYGDVSSVFVNGGFFTSPEALVNGIANGRSEHSGMWRVEGWDEKRIEKLNGQKCWLSGRRVLVYDPETGELVDHYYSLDNTLTIPEFNILLDIHREIAMKGGV